MRALRVRPSELTAEAPFIARAIEGTGQGFGLEPVLEREFPGTPLLEREFPGTPLDAAAIARTRTTLVHVRLWDYHPLLRTLGQVQTLRPYYTFSNVDIDRHVIEGVQRQVRLSARELAMIPVDRVSEAGLPEFLVKDIPPNRCPA